MGNTNTRARYLKKYKYNSLKNLSTDGYINRYKQIMKDPTPQQEQFAKDIYNLLVNDTDTSKITVFPGRCGIGKSQAIKALINYCVKKDNFNERRREAIGLVIVTDQLIRLEEYQYIRKADNTDYWGEYDYSQIQHEKYCAYISSRHATKTAYTLLVESQYKPIILLSTQRYFSLSEHMREMLFSYRISNDNKNEQYARRIVIFDEKPYFYSTKVIKFSNFNDVATALQQGIPSEDPEKDWVLNEYRKFRAEMENVLLQKEKTDKNENIFYWRDNSNTSMTRDDDKFFNIISDYKYDISRIKPLAFIDLHDFKRLIIEGAFFRTTKKSKGQDYETHFELYTDNHDKFYMGENKAKFFVFDATADIDSDYSVNYVKIINCQQYNTEIPMVIKQYDVNTSKSQIANKNDEKIIKAIRKDVQNKIGKTDEGLIATYMKIEKYFRDKNYKNLTVVHFGNIKGLNKYSHVQKMAHIGLNRSHHFNYFISWLAKRPMIFELIKTMDESKSRAFISNMTKQVKGLFENDELNTIMFNSLLVDFEQNIFRTAVRNLSNTKKVEILAYWNTDIFSVLNEMIERRYSPYSVKIEYLGIPPIIERAKIESRKTSSGEKTVPQKILKWYDEQSEGRVFKISEMLSELKIDNNQFLGAKKNRFVRELFNNIKMEKQGYYKIAL